MQGKIPRNIPLDLFEVALVNLINMNHSIVQLSAEIDWESMEKELSVYYSDKGRKSVPVRKIAGLLILKRMFKESDESVIERWIENPYWQYFTGEVYFQNKQPFDPSDFVHFRNRIGKEGFEIILKYSLQLFSKTVGSKIVVVDSTVQEKNITYPTDTKLQRKIMELCWSIGKQYGIKFRRSYKRKLKTWLLSIRFIKNKNGGKPGRKALRKMRTAAGSLVRELRRKLPESALLLLSKQLDIYEKVLNQKRGDSNKIYSLHELEVHCLSKGKAHKRYEFGTKSSIVWDLEEGVVLGAFDGRNKYDGHTLAPSLDQAERVSGNRPKEALVDRGYKGRKEIGGTKIIRPTSGVEHTTRYFRDKARKKMRKRAGIEPIISHLKYDHGLLRCFLKGVIGDSINMLLAGIGFNFKKKLKQLSFWPFLNFIKSFLLFEGKHLAKV